MDLLLSGASRLGINLSQPQQEQFAVFYDELIDWNSRINLTSITLWEDVQTRHFVDSLTPVLALPRIREPGERNLLDVGSGGGFPGVPLKIAFPRLRVVLIESTQKKVRFLEHLVDRLALKGVEVVTGRAEDLARDRRYREKFDAVVARAVAGLASLVEIIVPFCLIGGKAVALKKGDIAAEIRASSRIISLTGARLEGLVPVDIPELPDRRVLVTLGKVSRTPAQYPRQAGLPVKRPILASDGANGEST
ncbi:MAG: 16S rRNA (guanine(527)-N(7))-methyltransferase RsmG [Chloroflexi bacterium]|nr:16S rRNA (guanine(527)-N(7))-methyltransferase RsmG [Chloroflexota bacterium]